MIYAAYEVQWLSEFLKKINDPDLSDLFWYAPLNSSNEDLTAIMDSCSDSMVFWLSWSQFMMQINDNVGLLICSYGFDWPDLTSWCRSMVLIGWSTIWWSTAQIYVICPDMSLLMVLYRSTVVAELEIFM